MVFRHYLVVSLCILFSLNSFGQKLSISELKKISNSDLGSIEEVMNRKGFHFESEDEGFKSQNCKVYFWKFDNSNVFEVVRCINNQIVQGGVSYQYSSNLIHDNLRNECLRLGYIKVNTDVTNGRLRVLYRKGMDEVLFSSMNRSKGVLLNEVTIKIVN